MKLIYVAGPFRAMSEYVSGHQDMFAVQENIMTAMKVGVQIARMDGVFPVIPHANTMFFTGSAPDSVWLDGDLELLRRCDAICMTPDWQRSRGAVAEHEFAKERGMPIYYSAAELQAAIKSSWVAA